MNMKQMSRFLSRLRMERKSPKKDASGGFVPQQEVSVDGSFDFDDGNGEGNGHNGSGGGNRADQSGDDFNWPSGRWDRMSRFLRQS